MMERIRSKGHGVLVSRPTGGRQRSGVAQRRTAQTSTLLRKSSMTRRDEDVSLPPGVVSGCRPRQTDTGCFGPTRSRLISAFHLLLLLWIFPRSLIALLMVSVATPLSCKQMQMPMKKKWKNETVTINKNRFRGFKYTELSVPFLSRLGSVQLV